MMVRWTAKYVERAALAECSRLGGYEVRAIRFVAQQGRTWSFPFVLTVDAEYKVSEIPLAVVGSNGKEIMIISNGSK